jgi:hypothetical protein
MSRLVLKVRPDLAVVHTLRNPVPSSRGMDSWWRTGPGSSGVAKRLAGGVLFRREKALSELHNRARRLAITECAKRNK